MPDSTSIERIQIWIIGDETDLTSDKYPSDHPLVGRTPSKVDEINPEMMVDGGYIIVYRISDIAKLDMFTFVKTISETFSTSLPDRHFDVAICANINVEEYTSDEEWMEPFIAQTNRLIEAFDSVDPTNMEVQYVWSDDDDADFVSDYESDDEDDEDELDPRTDEFRGFVMNGIDFSKPSGGRVRKTSKKKYERSCCLRNSKHPKRNIKRHDIIIAKKRDYRRDEKIIRGFLKEFLAGKPAWIKEYREEVLKRWMRDFAIKEKEARQRKKEFKKKLTKKNYTRRTNTVRSITKAIGGYNPFYDPNKQ